METGDVLNVAPTLTFLKIIPAYMYIQFCTCSLFMNQYLKTAVYQSITLRIWAQNKEKYDTCTFFFVLFYLASCDYIEQLMNKDVCTVKMSSAVNQAQALQLCNDYGYDLMEFKTQLEHEVTVLSSCAETKIRWEMNVYVIQCAPYIIFFLSGQFLLIKAKICILDY